LFEREINIKEEQTGNNEKLFSKEEKHSRKMNALYIFLYKKRKAFCSFFKESKK
jgi:hypothetical protein